MKKFGIESPQRLSTFSPKNIALFAIYFLFILVAFIFFSFYSKITGWIFSDHKIDIFQDLDQVAFYFYPFDQELSHQLLKLDQVMQAYFSGENILQTQKEEIFELWNYFSQHKEYLGKVGFKQYDKLLSLLSDTYDLREEIFKLLGENQPFNYLVLLQNTNEKRPNGGFFGSFAFITLSGAHIDEMQIVDSYLPDYVAPEARLPLPSWTKAFLGESNAGFVAGNKFGFTDMDGKNIKTLYEKTFHSEYIESRKQAMFSPEKWDQLFEKDIKGVIFLDLEMVDFLLPPFKHIAWEWQFINANIDLIRGEERSNKKELYIQNLENYLKDNMLLLLKNTVNAFPTLLEKGYLNIYLSNISDKFRGLLQAYQLTTVYDPDFMYFWNINTAQNKSDAFLSKKVYLENEKGETIFSTDNQKIAIPELSPGYYYLYFVYIFDLPQSYQNEMYNLEDKYAIKMTDRERYILSLDPLDPEETSFPRLRETVEIVYLPYDIDILGFSGDGYKESIFDTPFSRGITFKSKILENQKTNVVRVELYVK